MSFGAQMWAILGYVVAGLIVAGVVLFFTHRRH